MSDHHPRYVVREQHGTTVGEIAHSWDFLILDSWVCYREVLHVKPSHASTSLRAAPLRRRVYAYAALLNTPPLCKCGCGQEIDVGAFSRHGGKAYSSYVDKVHERRARYRRDKATGRT